MTEEYLRKLRYLPENNKIRHIAELLQAGSTCKLDSKYRDYCLKTAKKELDKILLL